jgi:hypothetical protein
MYLCMFRHNYLSMNGTVSFPSFTWLCKYKEEYEQGEMWHSAQRAEISEEICMFQPGHCQATGTWLISADISMATIDCRGYKRKATDSFKRVHKEGPRYTRAMLGNQLVYYKLYSGRTFTDRRNTSCKSTLYLKRNAWTLERKVKWLSSQ